MSNNCLVTKLKAVVDNDNLPELMGLNLYIMPSATGRSEVYGNNVAWCPLRFSATQELKLVSNNAYFTNTNGDNLGTEISVTAGQNFYIYFSDTNEVQLHISDRFHVDFGSSAGNQYWYPKDIADMAYCEQLTYWLLTLCSGCEGDISNLLRLTNLVAVDFYGTNISGKIESLKDYDGALTSFNFRSGYIGGDFSCLPKNVIKYVGPGITWDPACGGNWTQNNRVGLSYKAVCIKNVCFEFAEDVDNYLISLATNTNTNTDPSDKAITIGCRVAYSPSETAAASIAVIKGWGWTISVNGTSL